MGASKRVRYDRKGDMEGISYLCHIVWIVMWSLSLMVISCNVFLEKNLWVSLVTKEEEGGHCCSWCSTFT